jgi:hypothetical protein
MKSRSLEILKLIVSGVALGFLLKYLVRYWQQLPALDLVRLAPTLLILTLWLTLARLFSAWFWARILNFISPGMSPLTAIRIHTRALLARYIPGNVWHVVNISLWCRQEGVPGRAVIAAMVLENACQVLGGAMVALLLSPWWLLRGSQAQVIALTTTLLIGLVLIHPRVLRGSLALPLRLLKKSPLAIPLSYGQNLLFVLLYAAVFLAQGLSLYLLSVVIEPSHPLSPLGTAGVYSAAWTIGFLSFLTPSGLGVREAMMTWILSRSIPMGSALLLPLLLRLLMTLAELLAAVIPMRRDRGSFMVSPIESMERCDQ